MVRNYQILTPRYDITAEKKFYSNKILRLDRIAAGVILQQIKPRRGEMIVATRDENKSNPVGVTGL